MKRTICNINVPHSVNQPQLSLKTQKNDPHLILLILNSCFAVSISKNGGPELSVAQRKYFTEIAALADKHVIVTTASGKKFTGTLIGINPDNFSLCLSEAKDEEGRIMHRIFLNGNDVTHIYTVEKPFDIKALAERLEKVFPTMVRLYEDKGFIWVMEKVKVTEKGIVEGSGPAAERVQKVYEQFMGEVKGRT
jgi:small nuclear ribonucleoprotein (snRNP)-like protein